MRLGGRRRFFLRCAHVPGAGQGLGRDSVSWGWDGYNCQKTNAGKTESFGSDSWRVGDVIGVLVDLDSRKISYYKNGNSLGVAFTDVPKEHFLYPACSLKRYQKVTYNFGKTPFAYPLKDAFPLHMALNEKQKAAVEKLFDHYQAKGMQLSESQEDRGDICKSDGVFLFATDAGAKDDLDPLLLIIAWSKWGRGERFAPLFSFFLFSHSVLFQSLEERSHGNSLVKNG